jgi:hypothetical protein
MGDPEEHKDEELSVKEEPKEAEPKEEVVVEPPKEVDDQPHQEA